MNNNLTEFSALQSYAKMMNTLNSWVLEPFLADDFTYESQNVFQAITSKKEFLNYITPKLQTIAKAGATVFAEMGEVHAYGRKQPCVVLAQNQKDNLVALVLAQVEENKLKRLDLCIVPLPNTAKRSGEYPS